MADQPPPTYPSVDTKSYPPPSAVYPQQQPPPQPYQGLVYQPDPSLPPGAYYTAGGPPGQQQPYVVTQAPKPAVAAPQPIPSYWVHLVLSCVVFWLFGGLFGLIAFILAVLAQTSTASNPDSAYKLGRASFGVSIAGIVVGAILIFVLGFQSVLTLFYNVARLVTTSGQTCSYTVDGLCFDYRFMSSNESCTNNNTHFYHDSYCYFNEY